MNLRESLSFVIKRLKAKGIKTADVDALIIVEQSINKNDLFVLSNPDYDISKTELQTIKELTKKREMFYPISYIRQKKEFYSFEFFVNNDVLIPRPETEMLVDETIKISKEFKSPIIVDVGTGSGCIAISVSKMSDAYVIASDISFRALLLAQKNAEQLKADVEFVCADTLSFLNKKVDIIVSNPPYIKSKDYHTLQPDIKFEPKLALLCENGIDIIEKLIKESERLCSYLILELGYNQKEFVENFQSCVYVKEDLSGLPRMAVFKFD